MDSQVQRYDGGLKQLAAAAESTEILSKDLTERNEVIAEKKIVVTGLIEEVTAKAEIADKDAKAAAIKKD
jgi:hypothetical protein